MSRNAQNFISADQVIPRLNPFLNQALENKDVSYIETLKQFASDEDLARLYLHNYRQKLMEMPRPDAAVTYAYKGFARYAQVALQEEIRNSANQDILQNEQEYNPQNAIDVEFARMGLVPAYDPARANLMPWQESEYRFNWRKFAYVHMQVESAINSKIGFVDRMLAANPAYQRNIPLLKNREDRFNRQIFDLCEQVFTRIVTSLEQAFLQDHETLSLTDKFNCKTIALAECNRIVEHIANNFDGFRTYSNYIAAQGRSLLEGPRILEGLNREDLTTYLEKTILSDLSDYRSADYSDIEGLNLAQRRDVLPNLTGIINEEMNRSRPYLLTKKSIEETARRNVAEIMRNREGANPSADIQQPQAAAALARSASSQKGVG